MANGNRLTAARARAVTQPGMCGDGGTLYLKVAPGGSKSWIQRITIDGRRHDIGLGGYPLVTLARAREAAFDSRRVARSGGDPLAAKRRAKTPTFREAAEETFATNERRWRKGKHTRNWMQSLAKYAFPAIGGMRVDRIGREDIVLLVRILVTAFDEPTCGASRHSNTSGSTLRGGSKAPRKFPLTRSSKVSSSTGVSQCTTNQVEPHLLRLRPASAR